ncbi:hypothetical protein QLQ15_13235 [Lysobacter sp. LF1]|uniref:Uncharacterized protein n=1 Tax=Lysobacter stagni TaxID=3045172 RepID=A0ABT6XIG1_9GAMM|nr:hypothetical protein [Lysobacter sp. LF1]MDI9239869.1 hypothetical protein [Lysobacter sp. LF1]
MSSLFAKSPLSEEQLFAEVEDVIRAAPAFGNLGDDSAEQHAWFGRAVSILSMWNPMKQLPFELAAQKAFDGNIATSRLGAREIVLALQQARHDLRIRSVGPLAVALPQGAVFDYFDELRKLVESAHSDLFFVDPYMDAEFAERYLLQVKKGVAVRLLGRELMAKLVPAVELIRQQEGMAIEVRSTSAIHDRFLFVDGVSCYQSGASFKDGAKKAPTMLTQVLDAFDAVKRNYEDLWLNATPR